MTGTFHVNVLPGTYRIAYAVTDTRQGDRYQFYERMTLYTSAFTVE